MSDSEQDRLAHAIAGLEDISRGGLGLTGSGGDAELGPVPESSAEEPRAFAVRPLYYGEPNVYVLKERAHFHPLGSPEVGFRMLWPGHVLQSETPAEQPV